MKAFDGRIGFIMSMNSKFMLRASAIVTRNFTDQFRSCFYTMPFLLRDFHTMLFRLMGILVSRYPQKNRSSSAAENLAGTVKLVSVAHALIRVIKLSFALKLHLKLLLCF